MKIRIKNCNLSYIAPRIRNIDDADVWRNGTISSSTGVWSTSDSRYTSNVIEFMRTASRVSVTGKTYKCIMYLYRQDGSYIGLINTASEDIPEGTKYMIMSIYDANNSATKEQLIADVSSVLQFADENEDVVEDYHNIVKILNRDKIL